VRIRSGAGPEPADVTDGTSPSGAAFLTTVPKIGALAALLRLLTTAIPAGAVDWPLLIAVLAVYAATNLGAFAVVAELPHAATLDSYRGLARRRCVCRRGRVARPRDRRWRRLAAAERNAAAITGPA
jgi:NADH-quinone oxidoreductase subunit N